MPQTPKNAAAVALGRLGGSANTTAQNRARKRNAQTAGRPGRICVRCRKPVRGGHKDPKLDDTCGGREWLWVSAATAEPKPDPARQLLREAFELLNNADTNLDRQDWSRATRKLLRLK